MNQSLFSFDEYDELKCEHVDLVEEQQIIFLPLKMNNRAQITVLSHYIH